MGKKLKIGIRLFILVAVVTLVVFAIVSQQNRTIANVDFRVDYPTTDTLVTSEELYKEVCKKIGTPEGVAIKNLNLPEIETIIERNPFVSNAEAFTTIRGDLIIKAVQRNPIVRVSVPGEKDFFIDEKGFSFFPSVRRTPHVLVATGNIPPVQKKWKIPFSIQTLEKDVVFQKSKLSEIYELAVYICNNTFLKSQIDQIYLNNENEFELVPKIGDHIILLGTTENLDEKFKKLVALYQEGFTNLGWDLYSKINLKYKNQVVCVKK